jgi:hypothetical protein
MKETRFEINRVVVTVAGTTGILGLLSTTREQPRALFCGLQNQLLRVALRKLELSCDQADQKQSWLVWEKRREKVDGASKVRGYEDGPGGWMGLLLLERR